MGSYKCKYRVNSHNTSDNQEERVNASSQAAARKLIECKYNGAKITWIGLPSQN